MGEDEAALPDGALRRLGSTGWRASRDIDGGLCFIDDDRRVVTGSRVTEIINVAAGTTRATIDDTSCRPAPSHDGKRFATAYLRVKIWSAEGQLLKQSDALPSFPRTVAFLPGDRRVLAATRGGQLALIDVETGKIVDSDRISSQRFDDLAVSPNGLDAYALTEDGQLLIRRIDPLGATRGPWTEERGVRAFALSPDGTRVALAPERGDRLRIVARSKGQTLREIDQLGVTVLRFTPDGMFLIGRGPADEITIWRLDDGSVAARIEAPAVHTREFAISRDGRSLCAAAGASLLFWRLPDGAAAGGNFGPHGDMDLVQFTADGDRLVTANGSDCRIWSASSGAELDQLDEEPRRALHISPRGSLAAWAVDDRVVLEQLRSHQREKVDLDPDARVSRLAISHDGKLLAVATDIALELRELPGGHRRHHHGHHDDRIDMIRFSADDTMVGISTREGRVRVWDVATGERRFGAQRGDEARCLALSPDGRWLACDTGGRNIHLWDLERGELDEKLDGDSVIGYRDLVFSPDGMLLAQLDWGREITLWDVTHRETIASFDPSPDRSTAIAFSPDSTRLACGNESGLGLIWNVVATDRRLAGRALIRQIYDALRHEDHAERRARSVYRAAPERQEHPGVWMDGGGLAVSVQEEGCLVTVTLTCRSDHFRLMVTVVKSAASDAPPVAPSRLGRWTRWWRGRLTAAGRAERRHARERAEEWQHIVRTRSLRLGWTRWSSSIREGQLSSSFVLDELPAPKLVGELMEAIAEAR